ncbi:hypothetical protein IE4771_PB00009 (plasmid) [Rhizobium etli bv. mimosae str. IE4771]|uniref:Uncharacterized protein n=1 Tax=Rhizobium etli bv. mimosae str. IE4771 TaxID=1432050 RepID=A0A060I7M7_RHIET|nr:hypothetical protein IE4771_PB00009 [Rhizobium sp. IE4771]
MLSEYDRWKTLGIKTRSTKNGCWRPKAHVVLWQIGTPLLFSFNTAPVDSKNCRNFDNAP